MKFRVIAILLLTSVLAGLLGTVTSATPSEQYYVGYAKVDINPYDFDTPDPNDLVAIPMADNGFADRRLSYEGKMDDNGDGVVDENDGIFATCIAITDSNGNTMLLAVLIIQTQRTAKAGLEGVSLHTTSLRSTGKDGCFGALSRPPADRVSPKRLCKPHQTPIV